MTIEVEIDDVARYGAIQAVLIGYLKKKPNQTKEQIMRGLKMTDEPVRRHLEDLEILGVLERQYIQGRAGKPKIAGVKFL